MPATNRTLRLVLLLLVLAVAVAAVLFYVRKRSEPRPLVLGGALEARMAGVGSLVGGRVARVHVDEGDAVTAGQLLVTLETEQIDRQIDEQRAVIDTAKAELAKALAGPRDQEIRKAEAVAANDERERRRLGALHSAGVVSREALDDASTKAKTSAEDLRLLREGTRREDLTAARAQVELQERRLASLEERRGEAVIRSPVAGTIRSFELRPGDLVVPNQPVAEVLEPSELWVRVYVPETLLGVVRLNMPVRVRVDTYPDHWFEGRVASIASEGEYTPRNIQTRAQRAEQVFGVKVVVASDSRLKPGMAAEVDLGVQEPGQ